MDLKDSKPKELISLFDISAIEIVSNQSKERTQTRKERGIIPVPDKPNPPDFPNRVSLHWKQIK